MNKLFKYLKPYTKYVIFAPLMMLFEVASDLFQPKILAIIVDKGVANNNTNLILKLCALMIGIALIGALGGIGCTINASIASVNFGSDIRSNLYEKIQSFSFANLDEFKAESLITRLTNDVVQVQNIIFMGLRALVRAPLLCIGGIIMVISINLKLSLILIIAVPLLFLSVFYIIKMSFPLFDKVQKKLDKVNGIMRENLTGVRVIKAFVRENFEKNRFDEANEQMTDITLKATRLTILVTPIMMLIMNLSIVAVLWFGGLQVKSETMQVGEIIAFINYMTQILFSLLMLAMMIMNVSRAQASGDRIFEVLDTKVDIHDNENSTSYTIKKGDIVFDNVSFRYKGAGGDPVLKNISFAANPGETVAILGSTGSGKSTLVNLIPRLYDVTEGRILIDGQDIRNIKLEILRDAISVVLQESILFTGSIKDNICWGKDNASYEDVIEASKAAEAHDFIVSFKEGYETLIGQRGVNVSGGQKQRISIARAIIKKPLILILDDSTSAVDMVTEGKIQKSLKRILKNTTCFVIAQRISTVLDADKIIVLEDGKIAAEGTHRELIKSSTIYRDIYRSQLGEEGLSDAK